MLLAFLPAVFDCPSLQGRLFAGRLLLVLLKTVSMKKILKMVGPAQCA